MSTNQRMLAFIIALVFTASTTHAVNAAVRGDDPGPRLQYGGTPIELHFDAPGANVTKVYVDGTPCIIVSFGNGDNKPTGKIDNSTLALSCNWSPR